MSSKHTNRTARRLLKIASLGLAGILAGFLQHRILDDLLGDHLLQLQPVELEHGDHLNETRREYLLLLDS